MTQPNQSELDKQLIEYATTLLEARRTNDYLMEAENRTRFARYITANYTLTSEVVEREQEAYARGSKDGWNHTAEGYSWVEQQKIEAYKKGYIDGGIAELTKDVT